MMQANSAACVSQGWQCIASRIVPKSARSHAGQFWAFFVSAGTLRGFKRLLSRTPCCSDPGMIFFGKPVPIFPDHALGCASRIEILPSNCTRGAFLNDPDRCPYLTDHIARRGSVNSDHASAVEPDRRDIPHFERADRPRIIEVAPSVKPRIRRRPACAGPLKVV